MTTTGPNPSDDRPTVEDATHDTATGPDAVSTEPGSPDVEGTTAETTGGADGRSAPEGTAPDGTAPDSTDPDSWAHDHSTEEVPVSTQTIDAEPRRVRVGTVVWGLVIAVVGVGVLALASGYVFDVELAFIGLVTLAGVALLAGSLINGARRRGR